MLKLNKTLVALMAAILSAVSTQVTTFATSDSIDTSASSINFSASINEVYTDAINGLNKDIRSRTTNNEITDFNLSLYNVSTDHKVTGTITLYYSDKTITSEPVSGYIETFDGIEGFVGVLDGYITVGLSEDGKEIRDRLTIDLNYLSSEENFTAVTIGSVGAEVSQIVFFGNKSEDVSELMNVNADHSINTYNNINENAKTKTTSDSSKSIAVDATPVFQSTDTAEDSGYETATISLYHAEELRNQGSMTVYAKVNSHTDEFEDFLRDTESMDEGILAAYPDSYMIEIVGADRYLHWNGGAVEPDENETTIDLTYKVYIPYAGIGWMDIGIPITTSSTTVDFRGVAINPIFDDNIVTWESYSSTGWSSSDFDG